jgi:hypothetical protein
LLDENLTRKNMEAKIVIIMATLGRRERECINLLSTPPEADCPAEGRPTD